MIFYASLQSWNLFLKKKFKETEGFSWKFKKDFKLFAALETRSAIIPVKKARELSPAG